jgi:FKBP-type peptidyl-prolyl cis-trans isomerase SlyD
MSENKPTITKNSIVTLSYLLFDTDNNPLFEGDQESISYLHGGYGDIFEKIEDQLNGKSVGFELKIQLEPEDAFGEYDAELLMLEDRHKLPSNIEVGMQFEGLPDLEDTNSNEIDDIDDIDEEALGNESVGELIQNAIIHAAEHSHEHIFTITDIVGDKVIMDGNHPFAGMAIRFIIKVKDIRPASEQEIAQKHSSTSSIDAILSVMDKKPTTLH